jgi:hypothetical protein
MTCPICDQKPVNCDCTPEERRMHSEIEDLEGRVPRWIPASERLPEEDRLVLWYRPDERWPVTSGRFERPHHVDEGGDLCVPLSEGRYTHWMPLPPPPPDRPEAIAAGDTATPPEPAIPPAWLSRPYWVDPAGGHRYGFPRLYDPATDGDMTAWLIASGYPESLAMQELACTFTACTQTVEK